MAEATDAPVVVVGTAGHIDHGKTSLLRALTGIDADRLPEERVRGMTIDVGYAHLAFADGVELDFVDVPGHDRLIGNMLVGAGEIDAALLVVAADDGPQPQTIEHLRLLDALGITAGLAVVTKVDLVDDARVAEVSREARALLEGTTLAGLPVLPVSSTTGQGIDTLRFALRAVRDAVAPSLVGSRSGSGAGPLRLAIDRAFGVKGRGTVVTGTLRGGSLEEGASLRREPGGDSVRVRGIQVHNQPRERHAGGRTALNLAGPGVATLRRGDVLTSGEGVLGTDRVLVDLRAAASAPRAGARARLHLGTDQVAATVRLVPARPMAAVLILERETATFAGDRALLREPASGSLIAGLRVLDPRPPRGVSRRRMTPERLEALAAAIEAGDPGGIVGARLAVHGALVEGAQAAFAPDVQAALQSAALQAVIEHHEANPMSAGLPLARARSAVLRHLRSLATVERRDAALAQGSVAALLDELVARGKLGRVGEALRDPAVGTALPPDLVAAMDRLVLALSVAAPPPLAEAAAAADCPAEGVRALAADGRIVRLGPDLAWSAATYQHLAALALDHARDAPLTPAALRDATGTSRKFVMAILEDLDRRGILERTPDGHVPGPRAPRAVAP